MFRLSKGRRKWVKKVFPMTQTVSLSIQRGSWGDRRWPPGLRRTEQGRLADMPAPRYRLLPPTPLPVAGPPLSRLSHLSSARPLTPCGPDQLESWLPERFTNQVARGTTSSDHPCWHLQGSVFLHVSVWKIKMPLRLKSKWQGNFLGQVHQ